jgi:hypothetical protein
MLHKIINSYLTSELEHIERYNKNKMSNINTFKSDENVLNKRALKKPSFLARLRWKMQSDLNKYGWD